MALTICIFTVGDMNNKHRAVSLTTRGTQTLNCVNNSNNSNNSAEKHVSINTNNSVAPPPPVVNGPVSNCQQQSPPDGVDQCNSGLTL
jgi:hypothetical protein